jgi:ribosomal protein S10
VTGYYHIYYHILIEPINSIFQLSKGQYVWTKINQSCVEGLRAFPGKSFVHHTAALQHDVNLHIFQQALPRVRPRPLCARRFHNARSPLFAAKPVPSLDTSAKPIDKPPPSSSPSSDSPSAPSTSSPSHNIATLPPNAQDLDDLRAPRSVQAAYLAPLRHPTTHGHLVCDLHLRSFSVRNVEFMTDFALRAAYYLGLPVKGPIPLPKRVERWTLHRSNFVHKSSQENFERITLKRKVQILDGNVEVVKIWLAYLRKYAFWGVGMKANVWENEGLGVFYLSLPAPSSPS